MVGRITVITGPMFAGKTTRLLEEIRSHMPKKTQVFRPLIDTREEGTLIKTHDGEVYPAIRVENMQAIYRVWVPEVAVVAIDEINMMPADAIEVCQDLKSRGVQVIVSGLDTDYKRDPFSPIDDLIMIADDVVLLTARCTSCDRAAQYSRRLMASHERIVPGGAELYEPRCVECFDL